MDKQQFDENFLALLKNGSRHDLVKYRNCIIDEEYRRVNLTNTDSIRKEYHNALAEENSRKKYYALHVLLLSSCVVTGIILVAVSIAMGNIGLAIFNGLVCIVNALNLISHSMSYLFHCFAYKELKDGTVLVLQKNEMNKENFSPEIFSVISRDTKETLARKKEKLDEMLGL